MQNTALANLGIFADLSSGFSTPVADTRGATGNNVAFLGSYAEYANFCSLYYANGTTPLPASPALAQTNYQALTFSHTDTGEPGRTSSPIVGGICVGLRSRVYDVNPLFAGAISTMTNDVPPYYLRPMLWVDNSAGASLFTSR
jgi:hypothetical protein